MQSHHSQLVQILVGKINRFAVPISRVKTFIDIMMKSRIGPVFDLFYPPMFNWIIVNMIKVIRIILFITKAMFPKTEHRYKLSLFVMFRTADSSLVPRTKNSSDYSCLHQSSNKLRSLSYILAARGASNPKIGPSS
jgi:hypothetical protein